MEDNLGSRSKITDIMEPEYRKGLGEEGITFRNHLHRSEYGNYKERLHLLAEKIFVQGEKIEKRLDIKELLVYKRLVSEFLNDIVNNAYKFSKKSSLNRRGNYSTHSIIKKINEKLDNLTEDLLDNQTDNLKILRRLDDIKGLIIDLMM